MKEVNYWMWLRVLGICACQMGSAFCDLSSPLDKYIHICICREGEGEREREREREREIHIYIYMYIYICRYIYVCIRTELLGAR